jgi:cellulose synthase/poly-beta-1,6-N-acetylglucosamine synthase-like glycosyltransferase
MKSKTTQHIASGCWAAKRSNIDAHLTLICIAFTMVASGFAFADIGTIALQKVQEERWLNLVEQVIFAFAVAFLIYGNLVYQLARFGAVRRSDAHRSAPEKDFRALFRGHSPSISVLIPSHKEEPQVVLCTMLSAALMEYPAKRIVLLVDDPPNPQAHGDRELLNKVRLLANEASAMLAGARAFCQSELHLLRNRSQAALNCEYERRRLTAAWRTTALHLDNLARSFDGGDHAQRFFVDHVLRRPAEALRKRARLLGTHASATSDQLQAEQLELEYRRLLSRFAAEFDTFERKCFSNLSHAPNKAMNINSYLALMGRSVCVDVDERGEHMIRDALAGEDALDVPASDYVITLDADSMLLSEYALRLVHFMEDPKNSRVGIIQTPYSAYSGATSPIEQIAAITTDIQHIVHQGSTQYNGTFWVGANAVIRRAALADIAVSQMEEGRLVTKFIQDRTVIEDTESTVDLMLKGWKLYNYPARLAYSATPPDFGSLVIQRRRWANGGLIIVGKLLRYFAREPKTPARFLQAFVQTHYLTSLAGASVGVLLLILFPFEEAMRSIWLPLTAAPYFYLYGRDMVQNGYRWRQLPGVYALNLLLLAVNLGGVTKSIHQMVTGRGTPFARTPKVAERTPAPALYVVSAFVLVLYCFFGAAVDALAERWAHATFALMNAVLFTYAFAVFVGPRNALEDVALWVRARRGDQGRSCGATAVIHELPAHSAAKHFRHHHVRLGLPQHRLDISAATSELQENGTASHRPSTASRALH